jgi:hypothetical protein
MAINVSQLTDYTWAQIQLAAKTALMSAALGGARLVVEGRDITRISIQEAKALYDFASEMIAIEAAGNSGLGNVLVRIGNPQ